MFLPRVSFFKSIIGYVCQKLGLGVHREKNSVPVFDSTRQGDKSEKWLFPLCPAGSLDTSTRAVILAGAGQAEASCPRKPRAREIGPASSCFRLFSRHAHQRPPPSSSTTQPNPQSTRWRSREREKAVRVSGEVERGKRPSRSVTILSPSSSGS